MTDSIRWTHAIHPGDVVEITDIDFIRKWRFVGKVKNDRLEDEALFLFQGTDSEWFMIGKPIAKFHNEFVWIEWEKLYFGKSLETMAPRIRFHCEDECTHVA